MKYICLIGPLAILFAILLLFWGSIDPEGKGYGIPMLMLFATSIIAGCAGIREKNSTYARILSWSSIIIPLGFLTYFLLTVITLAY